MSQVLHKEGKASFDKTNNTLSIVFPKDPSPPSCPPRPTALPRSASDHDRSAQGHSAAKSISSPPGEAPRPRVDTKTSQSANTPEFLVSECTLEPAASRGALPQNLDGEGGLPSADELHLTEQHGLPSAHAQSVPPTPAHVLTPSPVAPSTQGSNGGCSETLKVSISLGVRLRGTDQGTVREEPDVAPTSIPSSDQDPPSGLASLPSAQSPRVPTQAAPSELNGQSPDSLAAPACHASSHCHVSPAAAALELSSEAPLKLLSDPVPVSDSATHASTPSSTSIPRPLSQTASLPYFKVRDSHPPMEATAQSRVDGDVEATVQSRGDSHVEATAQSCADGPVDAGDAMLGTLVTIPSTEGPSASGEAGGAVGSQTASVSQDPAVLRHRALTDVQQRWQALHRERDQRDRALQAAEGNSQNRQAWAGQDTAHVAAGQGPVDACGDQPSSPHRTLTPGEAPPSGAACARDPGKTALAGFLDGNGPSVFGAESKNVDRSGASSAACSDISDALSLVPKKASTAAGDAADVGRGGDATTRACSEALGQVANAAGSAQVAGPVPMGTDDPALQEATATVPEVPIAGGEAVGCLLSRSLMIWEVEAPVSGDLHEEALVSGDLHEEKAEEQAVEQSSSQGPHEGSEASEAVAQGRPVEKRVEDLHRRTMGGTGESKGSTAGACPIKSVSVVDLAHSSPLSLAPVSDSTRELLHVLLARRERTAVGNRGAGDQCLSPTTCGSGDASEVANLARADDTVQLIKDLD